MGKDSLYYKEKKKKQLLRLRSLIDDLPRCAADFIHYREVTSQPSTLIQYSYDLIIFFKFLSSVNPVFARLKPSEVTDDIMDHITSDDIIEYQRYLELNTENDYHEEGKKTIARRMSPLRGMFRYLLVNDRIKKNPMDLVANPRIKKDKNIIRMNADEVGRVMDTINNGSVSMTQRQKLFSEKTRFRDNAIITLILNTGIRVSECRGLDIDDVDLKAGTIVIVRKGGGQDVLYLGHEVIEAISDYKKNERGGIKIKEGHEKAMFLSLQGKRISIDAIENLVRKYTRIAVPLKKITPHKLRSTYGTALYRETGDIRLVADVLGHENINTTIDYYAAIEDEHKREAADAVDYKKMKKKK